MHHLQANSDFNAVLHFSILVVSLFLELVVPRRHAGVLDRTRGGGALEWQEGVSGTSMDSQKAP